MVREEYPRPQFVRPQWQNLNGEWEFAFDDQEQGYAQGWHAGQGTLPKTIVVPFAYQTKLSGIDDQEPHDHVWYRRRFELANEDGHRYLLHFGAVDYAATVYVNGHCVGQHVGGETAFCLDVTADLNVGENLLAVQVDDPHQDESIPRGKQTWEEQSAGIWYTNTTGIWQTVWLEAVPACYLADLKVTPEFDQGSVRIQAVLNQAQVGAKLQYRIEFQGTLVAAGAIETTGRETSWAVDLFQQKIFRTNYHRPGWSWTPEHPNLFDLTLTVGDDRVQSYFGMRKISVENGMIYLNNQPYYQKLVLDQGYWPAGLLTAPSDQALKDDIVMAKEMGFNGCRKHQKVEDPRFLYWADRLGYLVWGECASAPLYNADAVRRVTHEWDEIIARDYNHPCIVTWVPLNESWGVPHIQRDRQQQHFSQSLYHYLHSLDETRLVIGNDGWSQAETDICTIHDYAHGTEDEPLVQAAFATTLYDRAHLLAYSPAGRRVFADGFGWQGQPIMLTEFGGISYQSDQSQGWGYTSASSKEQYLADFSRIFGALYASEILWGFCYTQLTDVEQEINGLLTYDRQPKLPLADIKHVLAGYHPECLVDVHA